MKMPPKVTEFFRKQGRIGARKRAANLSPERRQEIARHAATARWAKNEEKASDVKETK
jgi:hypothetical protein